MPRSTHETSRDPAARATHSTEQDDPQDAVTDEGLGLLPPGRAEVIDEETDLSTTPHRLDGADAEGLGADVEPSLVDQALLTDPMAAMAARRMGRIAAASRFAPLGHHAPSGPAATPPRAPTDHHRAARSAALICSAASSEIS